MTIWKYMFADGTKLELLNIGLSTDEVRKLMELHGACTVDFEVIERREGMIRTKYPEWVEAQLKILDERIEEIYQEYAEIKVRPDEAMRIKKNLYERTKPFIDEKVRLITNSYPTYTVEGSESE